MAAVARHVLSIVEGIGTSNVVSLSKVPVTVKLLTAQLATPE